MTEDSKEVEPVERHLVYKCCLCDVEYDRKPLPADYGKGLPEKYQTGDIHSHGYCPSCVGKVLGDR